MQSKVKFFNRPMPTVTQERRYQLNWGIAGIVIVVILGLLAGYLYLGQPGKKEIQARFTEAQTVMNGADVRVDGFRVGSVTGTKIEDGDVLVTMKIDSNIFVGDASTIATRMLTVVGGYYLALNPLGTSPLTSPIPPERVTTPYSLLETFQHATPKLQAVDVTPIRETMAQLNEALVGHPDSIRNGVQSFDKMVDNVIRQQDQAGEFIKILGQYSGQVRDNGELLVSIMHNFATFFAAGQVNLAGFQSYLTNVQQIVQRLVPVENVYLNQIDPLASRLDALVAKAKQLLAQAEPTIQQGVSLIKKLQAQIAPDGSISVNQAAKRFLATNVCIPAPGVSC
ncbi:MlaD family protein [Tsukamurella soli]|uniref:MCE family protein n=1 Tax=Tsukamurella soli TaxID=644556 RepID=A0ABP8K4T3_9ACTN